MQCYSCERQIFTTGPNIFYGTCMVEIGLQRLESRIKITQAMKLGNQGQV